MSLDIRGTGKIYTKLKNIIKDSGVCDEGIIPSIFVILISDLFSEIQPSSIKCKILKSQYIIGQASFEKTNTYESYYNGDFVVEDYAIKIAQNILRDIVGLKYEEQKISTNFEEDTKIIDFIITPTGDSFKDDDLLYIFKALQLYSHDIKYNEDRTLYRMFSPLIKDIFEEFQEDITIWPQDMDIFCNIFESMKRNIMANTFINYFGFKENEDLFVNEGGVTIKPIDRKDYERLKEEKNEG